MGIILLFIGGPLFLLAAFAHIYVKIKLKPKEDLDDYYWEFEDSAPGFARYERWSQITFVAAIIGVLLLFMAIIF